MPMLQRISQQIRLGGSMKILVTDIEFDTDDELTFDEEISLHDTALGIWEVEDEDELVDKISDVTGWCIRNIDYTLNLIHPLTSYK
tara:strand:+ start:199 stop:456 length:258 start_codon:yes stop_codon:yes gene_type:complete